jgi:uncharacterized protein YjbI with pentapeptide repeats
MKTLTTMRSRAYGLCGLCAVALLAVSAAGAQEDIGGGGDAAVDAIQHLALAATCGMPPHGLEIPGGPYYNNCDGKDMRGFAFPPGTIGGGPPTGDGSNMGTATPQFLHAHLEGASMVGAGMQNGNLSIMFNYAFLTGTNLSHGSLNASQFMHALGEHAIFTGSKLRSANFSYADFSGADFSGVDLNGAQFIGTNLAGANFTGADLTGVNMNGANLTNAHLNNAALYGTQFVDATLIGTTFNGATYSGINLTGVHATSFQSLVYQFSSAHCAGSYVLPNGELETVCPK